jgi:hemolysin III
MLRNLREPVSGLLHLGGAIASLAGLTYLAFLSWGWTTRLVSVVVYGASLVLLFLSSTVYHLTQARPAVINILRKLDHSAIYVLIAGTYTPFCLLAFQGFYRWGLLALIWLIALAGIVMKIRLGRLPRWVNAGVYVIMGWLCVLAAPQMAAVLSAQTLTWLVIGGLVYTLGAVVYSTKIFNFFPGKFGFHEIWHLFVLAGALAHFLSVRSLIVS